MRDMHWYVYCENFNGRKIETYDIFTHGGFMEDVRKAYRKHKNDHDAFCENVRKSLGYYFWGKCEWEIILSSWPPSERIPEKKIDVYQQVMMNWDVFIEYVWTRAHERKRKAGDL